MTTMVQDWAKALEDAALALYDFTQGIQQDIDDAEFMRLYAALDATGVSIDAMRVGHTGIDDLRAMLTGGGQ